MRGPACRSLSYFRVGERECYRKRMNETTLAKQFRDKNWRLDDKRQWCHLQFTEWEVLYSRAVPATGGWLVTTSTLSGEWLSGWTPELEDVFPLAEYQQAWWSSMEGGEEQVRTSWQQTPKGLARQVAPGLFQEIVLTPAGIVELRTRIGDFQTALFAPVAHHRQPLASEFGGGRLTDAEPRWEVVANERLSEFQEDWKRRVEAYALTGALVQ